MPPKKVKKVMTAPINVIFGHLQVSMALKPSYRKSSSGEDFKWLLIQQTSQASLTSHFLCRFEWSIRMVDFLNKKSTPNEQTTIENQTKN